MKFSGSSCLAVTLSLLSSGAAPPLQHPCLVLTERTQSLSSESPFCSSYPTNLPADACALPFWSRHLPDGFLWFFLFCSQHWLSSLHVGTDFVATSFSNVFICFSGCLCHVFFVALRSSIFISSCGTFKVAPSELLTAACGI